MFGSSQNLVRFSCFTCVTQLDGAQEIVDNYVMSRLVYFDQNVWIALAKGAWDMQRYPQEHAVFCRVVEMVQSDSVKVILSNTNIYETFKINDPVRRKNLALLQTLISGGIVFRGRRSILAETLAEHIANEYAICRGRPTKYWFLSDLWFEAAGDYSPKDYGFAISKSTLNLIRQNPQHALLDYLMLSSEKVRLEAVQRYSAVSNDLISRIEERRALAAGQPLAMRKRVYSARLMLDELSFIMATARDLGVNWASVVDIGSSMMRGILANVPVLNIERELAVRLEDQGRSISENDLRDMSAFSTVLPLVDVLVAEKQFINLARQARLGDLYNTILLTSINDLEGQT